MKKARKAPHIPLSDLKLSDLYADPFDPADTRLVNLKVPADLLSRVHKIAKQLGVTKSAAIIALINEGLESSASRNETPSGRSRKPA